MISKQFVFIFVFLISLDISKSLLLLDNVDIEEEDAVEQKNETTRWESSTCLTLQFSSNIIISIKDIDMVPIEVKQAFLQRIERTSNCPKIKNGITNSSSSRYNRPTHRNFKKEEDLNIHEILIVPIIIPISSTIGFDRLVITFGYDANKIEYWLHKVYIIQDNAHLPSNNYEMTPINSRLLRSQIGSLSICNETTYITTIIGQSQLQEVYVTLNNLIFEMFLTKIEDINEEMSYHENIESSKKTKDVCELMIEPSSVLDHENFLSTNIDPDNLSAVSTILITSGVAALIIIFILIFVLIYHTHFMTDSGWINENSSKKNNIATTTTFSKSNIYI